MQEKESQPRIIKHKNVSCVCRIHLFSSNYKILTFRLEQRRETAALHTVEGYLTHTHTHLYMGTNINAAQQSEVCISIMRLRR